MKRLAMLALALVMLFSMLTVHAETVGEEPAETENTEVETVETEEVEAEELPTSGNVYDMDELVVIGNTPFGGNFFNHQWGNAISDIDARKLLHGYNLMEWRGEEGMFRVDPSVVSGVVATQNTADGDHTYTLALYEDLTYNDGTPITAWDYAFSILLTNSPQVSELVGTLQPMDYLVGYDAYAAGQVNYISGVRVMSDDVLAITIKGDYLPFFYEVGLLDVYPYPISEIAPGCTVRDDGNGAYINGPFTADLLRQTIEDPETGYLSHPGVTSGPYQFVSYDGEALAVEINPNYKGNSDNIKPSIQRLIYKIVPTEDMIPMFESGEAGLVVRVTRADEIQAGMDLIAEYYDLQMSPYPRSGLSYIAFCCEKPTVGSEAVRKAISLCMDRETFQAETVADFGILANGYYGLGQWMYQLALGSLDYTPEEPAANAPDDVKEKYENDLALIEKLNETHMDAVPVYALDVEAAIALLVEDGWTLNRAGEAYDAEKDDVRCKEVNGELTALDLKLIVPEENTMTDALELAMKDNMAQAGMLITIEKVPYNELVKQYHRHGEQRDCDMVFIASNFDEVFDPSMVFMPDGDEPNMYNYMAIQDQQLYELAVSMRETEPGDVMNYVMKWLDFQVRFQEVAPMIPLYSNVYYDFHPEVLRLYDVTPYVTWSQAIVAAYMSEEPDPAREPVEELAEGEVTF